MILFLKYLIFIICLLFFIVIAIEFVREVTIICFPKFKNSKVNKTWISLDRKSYEVIKNLAEIKIVSVVINSFYALVIYLMVALMCWTIFVFTFPFVFIGQVFQFIFFCCGKKYKKDDIFIVSYFNFLINFCKGKYL